MYPRGRLLPHSTWLEDEDPEFIDEDTFPDAQPVWQPPRPQRARNTRPVIAAGRPTRRLPAIESGPVSGPLPPSAQFVGPMRTPQWLGLLIAFAFVFAALGAALALIVGLLGPGAPATAGTANPQRTVAPTPTVAPTHAPTATSLPTATPTASATATPSVTASPGPSVGAATFASTDTSTQGSWQGVYGSTGYSVVADAQQLPSAITLTASGASVRTWQSSTSDGRALQKPGFPLDRIASCWYSTGTFSLDLNITDGQTYQVALYLLDWDQQNRVETVSLVDPSSFATLDTRNVSNFANGEYLVWTVSGHVTIQIANGSGSPDAVASALFLAPASPSTGQ